MEERGAFSLRRCSFVQYLIACALSYAAAPASALHFVNKVDRIRDIVLSPADGLVLDEAYFAALDVDDIKAILDVEHSRDEACRNIDGRIPKKGFR